VWPLARADKRLGIFLVGEELRMSYALLAALIALAVMRPVSEVDAVLDRLSPFVATGLDYAVLVVSTVTQLFQTFVALAF
jgi:hypothetical protein